MISVELIFRHQLSDKEQQKLYELVVHAYAETEKEIWGDHYVRIEQNEFLNLLEKGELLIAKYEGEIVGSIHFYLVDQNTYGFGLLNVDFNHLGKGIGQKLIKAAEEEAKNRGAKQMKLDILRPLDVKAPFKDWLATYYRSLGYRHIKTIGFLEIEPLLTEKFEKMVNPSVFDQYLKELL
jgi:GNAT superfamily N-acetyltransferase